MRIAIFGVGAVGGYFGGRLANAGHDVTFVARGETLSRLQTRGLEVTSALGDFVAHPKAVADPNEAGPSEFRDLLRAVALRIAGEWQTRFLIANVGAVSARKAAHAAAYFWAVFGLSSIPKPGRSETVM